MDWTKDKVREELKRGWTGPDRTCPYHPCHFNGQDCTYCFCPFYPCADPDLGSYVRSGRTGEDIWSCSDCHLIHRIPACKEIATIVEEEGITDPDDPRLREILPRIKEKHLRPGRALMVLGATSGAGKSLTVTALCRILSDRCLAVTPFKSQNMSLNSYVTRGGYEISRIQHLQSMAARIEPDFRVNPILLKPKGDDVSQVIVDGKPFGDYDVTSYYEDFVPGPGTDCLKRNLEFLKRKYDFVVMEGAGSPAEINIYDKDIANMRAAEIADADCVLVVNMEWGGAFAYAYGTISLLREDDRKRVKGIILNNMHGDASSLKPGIEMLEKELGIPVMGVIPHVRLFLPTEDSMFFQEGISRGDGRVEVAVIRLPRISNFTDFDALALEDVSVRFVESPQELSTAQAIIIPGTKNTVEDLRWLRLTGLGEAICSRKGKVPILGICGGYQMMGRTILDLQGLEGGEPQELDGLGLLDTVTEFSTYDKRTKQVKGILMPGGEPIRGYEIHMGATDRGSHKSLFELEDFNGKHEEGCRDDENMIFGTYLHGLFDLPSFRRQFLSLVPEMDLECSEEDISDVIEENLDMLASHYLEHLDPVLLEKFFRGDL